MQEQGARVVWERSLRVVWELGETVGQESWVKEWDEREGWEVREWVAEVGCKSSAGIVCESGVQECGERVVWERSLRVEWELCETVGQESWAREWN